MSAVGSEESASFCNSIFAPICLRACKKPILVGFTPTFLSNNSELGVISAANIKKDAEEKSPQISIFVGFMPSTLFNLINFVALDCNTSKGIPNC